MDPSGSVKVKRILDQLVFNFLVERSNVLLTRTESISVRIIRMLCQLVAPGPVKRAIIKFDVFFFVVFDKVFNVKEVGNHQKIIAYHIKASFTASTTKNKKTTSKKVSYPVETCPEVQK